MSGKRITVTLTPQVNDLIDQMLATGLFGSSRAAIVERLVCDGVLKCLESGLIKQQPPKRKK